MAEISRREFVSGGAAVASMAALPTTASALPGQIVELEDRIGRELLARIFAAQWQRGAYEADWELIFRYSKVRFEEGGRLYASDSFRANVGACLADREPRFFAIRYYYDLALFNALVWNNHPSFRGLAGVAGDTIAWNADEFTVQFLVAPVERIVAEKAKHREVRRWSMFFCADEDRRVLMASDVTLPTRRDPQAGAERG